AACVYGRRSDEALAGSCACPAGAPVDENRTTDSSRPGGFGTFLPCQRSRTATGITSRSPSATRNARAAADVDRCTRSCLVEGASPFVTGITAVDRLVTDDMRNIIAALQFQSTGRCSSAH